MAPCAVAKHFPHGSAANGKEGVLASRIEGGLGMPDAGLQSTISSSVTAQ